MPLQHIAQERIARAKPGQRGQDVPGARAQGPPGVVQVLPHGKEPVGSDQSDDLDRQRTEGDQIDDSQQAEKQRAGQDEP